VNGGAPAFWEEWNHEGQTCDCDRDRITHGTSWVVLRRFDHFPSRVDTWQKSVGGTGEDIANAVITNRAGRLVVTGVATDSAHGLGGLYLAELDAHGKFLWSKTYGGAATRNEGFDVLQTEDGGYVVAGTSSSEGSPKQVYLIRTDAVGCLPGRSNIRAMQRGGGINLRQYHA